MCPLSAVKASPTPPPPPPHLCVATAPALSWGRYHGGRRPSTDDSLHSPTVIAPFTRQTEYHEASSSSGNVQSHLTSPFADTHLLQALQDWNLLYGPFDDNTLLVTLDVVGLYTNIPHDDLHTTLHHFLDNGTASNSPPVEELASWIMF